MLFKIKLYVYYPVTKMLVTGYMPKLYVLLYSKKEIKLSKNKKFPVCRRPTWLRVFFVAGELCSCARHWTRYEYHDEKNGMHVIRALNEA